MTKQDYRFIQTEGTPLIDPGTGQPFIIRQFEFSFDPSVVKKIKEKKLPPPTKQELFDATWPQIRIQLWGDGLVALEEKEYPPRIVIGKKKYKVYLVCQPQKRMMVAEKPFTLQELTQPRKWHIHTTIASTAKLSFVLSVT